MFSQAEYSNDIISTFINVSASNSAYKRIDYFRKKDLVLRKELIKLDAKKFVFTNGSHDHVKNITKHLGIDDLFTGTFDITDCNLIPKPSLEPYEKLVKKFGIIPEETIFIEDIAKNLEPAKKLGMKTAWLINLSLIHI